jgi:hypothetical protein
MRARANLRHQAQSNSRRRQAQVELAARAPDCFFNQLDLVNRIHIDRINAGPDRFVQLFIGLAGAIKNDLVRPKTRAQSLE